MVLPLLVALDNGALSGTVDAQEVQQRLTLRAKHCTITPKPRCLIRKLRGYCRSALDSFEAERELSGFTGLRLRFVIYTSQEPRTFLKNASFHLRESYAIA